MFDYYYLLRDSLAFFPTLTDCGKLIFKKQPMLPALLPLLVFLLGWMAATGGQGKLLALPAASVPAHSFTNAEENAGISEQLYNIDLVSTGD